jgi:pimeloyl-ACP methyl ester carboxylesterase
MKEIRVKFRSEDCTLGGTLHIPSRKTHSAIIFVNALGQSYLEDFLAIDAARTFCRKGYAFLRFNHRGMWPSTGKPSKTGLFDQVKDVESAIGFMKGRGYKKIGLIGHSIGGLKVILADKKGVSAIVLFEPSVASGWATSDNTGLKVKNKYYINEDFDIMFSKKFIDDFKKLRSAVPHLEASACPVLFIAGDKNFLTQKVKEYYRSANAPKSLKIIPGADHLFDTYIHEIKALRYSLDWFGKWLR